MLDWIQDHPGLLWTLGAVSLVTLIASVLVVPALVAQIRPDYFVHARRPPSRWADQHPLVRILARIGKNVLGLVLIVAGLAMFVLPGQGLLTLFAGFLLMDFPGKYRFEKWLVHRPPVRRSINWIRRRAGRGPLEPA